MSSSEIIRAEVNEGDSLKSIVVVEDFTRQFKCRYYNINVEETSNQYWGIGMFSLRCNAKFFYVDLSCCKKEFRNLS